MMQRFTKVLVAITAAAVMPISAAAEWPDRPLQLIVQFPPGTTTDAVARDLATHMSDALGQPVVIANKPGAGGIIGVTALARSKPDGYTFGTVNYPVLTIIPHQQPVGYDPVNDFTHLGVIGPYEYGIFVRSDAPWKTFEELVEYGSKNPGKLTFGTLGAGTTNQLTMSRLGDDLGMKWSYVPYKGDNESVTALLGGQIDVINASATATLPHVKADKIRMLVSTSNNRWAALPDTPTLRQTGKVNYAQESYFSLAAPAGIPDVAKEKLTSTLQKILSDPNVIRSLQERYGQPVQFQDGNSYAKTIKTDFERYKNEVTPIDKQK
jgi:tripartite-type tricarboxylate transporter receptor subunit TctC